MREVEECEREEGTWCYVRGYGPRGELEHAGVNVSARRLVRWPAVWPFRRDLMSMPAEVKTTLYRTLLRLGREFDRRPAAKANIAACKKAVAAIEKGPDRSRRVEVVGGSFGRCCVYDTTVS